MAILAECPVCHKKQTVRSKICHCGEDLDKAKRAQKVRYWINYRFPGGKQKREAVGFSIEEARDAEGKRRSQKRENRIFDIKPEAKMSFNELTKWYLNLENVKSKAYFVTLEINLRNFNKVFGDMIIGNLKPVDLENYQVRRKADGYSDAYIDHEISAAKTMVNKAFANNIVSGDTFKSFMNVRKLLKNNANARDRILSPSEFSKLMENLPLHTKQIIATGFYTGMRKSEVVKLTWDKVDLKQRIIRLEAKDTKDREARNIPIGGELFEILSNIPRSLDDNHVFLYKGKPFTEFRRSLRTACKEAGIIYGRFEKDGFVNHDLRHTFNTYMRKAGIDASVTMKITGHSTMSMYNRYNTVDDDDTRKAVDQMEGYLKTVDQNVDQDAQRG